MDKLDVDKFKNVPTKLSNLKSEADKLGADKLVPVLVNLSKLSNVGKMMSLKEDVYNAKIKNIVDKTPDIANLVTNTTLNAKINKIRSEIPNVTYLATTAALTVVKNKITQKLVKFKIKFILTMIMTNTLLLKNLRI